MRNQLMKSICYLSVLIGSLLTAANSSAADSPKPGFDCAKATTGTEKRICGSRELSILDKDMSGLYRTLIAGEYPQTATKQKEWLEKRNQCETSKEPEPCLVDLYKKRVVELAKLHVEAYRFGQPYCGKECLYQWGYEIEDIRLGSGAVEYLVLNGRYIYGVVTTEYYIGTFGNGRLEPKEPICSKQVEDDGQGAVSGDKDCTSEKAGAHFRASRR
jgi:uncharacterized protein